MRLKIINSDRFGGVKLVNAETDEVIEGVQSVSWDYRGRSPIEVAIVLSDVEIKIDTWAQRHAGHEGDQ